MTTQAPLHSSRICTRWSDMDALGHVNNARFFTYIEQARIDWMDSLPSGWHREDSAPVLARVEMDFRAPIVHPEQLVVEQRVARVGGKSLTLTVTIRQADGDTVFAEANTVLVWIDPRQGKAVDLPEAVRQAVGE